MKKYIEIIRQFESKKAKYYWIKALKVSEAEKGFLVYYFNLLKA